ncbi:TolC family protein [Sulfurimonas crateris]|uniref:TolC family protein n=1 Tax=Sulfurimonas crateris TaxID=2574727 RepID=A0A4U2ZA24_9BACT|nr:TolC family protein [Sulfurimonas crateris]TKI71207.1 TolC family protein [Sulfurimonas crateris]
MKTVKFTLICTLFSALLCASEVMPIDLQSVLELGGANNLTIKEFQAKQEEALKSLEKAKEWWLPNIYAGVKTQQLWGAAMNGNGSFYTDVDSDNLWGGVGVKMRLNFADGIYKTKAAQLNVRTHSFESIAEKNQVLLSCVNAYYDMAYEQLKYKAYKNLAEQSDTLMQQIAIQVEAGLRYQSELLLAKGNHAHLKLEMINAQSAYERKSAELVRLLHLKNSVKLSIGEELLLPLDFQTISDINSDIAYTNRAEIKAIDSSILSLQKEKKSITEGIWMPELSIDTYTSYFGSLRGDMTPVALNQGSKQLYPTQGLNLSLLWNIPLGELLYRSSEEKYNAKIQTERVKLQQMDAQINEELSNATQDIEIGKEKITLSKEALNSTKEALNQSIERQKQGTAKPFEVFQVQQFYLQSKIDYLKAISDYNKAQFALKVAKGETL